MPADVAAFTIGMYTPFEFLSTAGRSAIAGLLYSDSIEHFSCNLRSAGVETQAGEDPLPAAIVARYARLMNIDTERLAAGFEREMSLLSGRRWVEDLHAAGMLDDEGLVFAQLLGQLDAREIGIKITPSARVGLEMLCALPELRRASGVVPLFDKGALTFVMWAEEQARRYGGRPELHDLTAQLNVHEGLLAHELLGSLPAFPGAQLDVVLDVRSRLQGPRIRFRAAVHDAAKELEALPFNDLPGAVMSIRRNTVEPAVQEIRETLEDLKAAPSLLRIASDRVTLASATASLAVVAGAAVGHVDMSALFPALAAAPALGGAAAREALARRETHRKAAGRPFYLLYELESAARG